MKEDRKPPQLLQVQTEPAPTPPPWQKYQLADDDKTYGENAGKFIIVAADGELEVCGIVANDADADLIAAAPELLEAAKNYATAWDRTNESLRKRLLEVIAKAERKT
jgi:hypothetical protein